MKMKKRNASKKRERGADGTVRLEWKERRMRVKQRNIRADKTLLVLHDRSGILRSPISASAFFSSLSYPKLAEQKIPVNTYIACIGSPSTRALGSSLYNTDIFAGNGCLNSRRREIRSSRREAWLYVYIRMVIRTKPRIKLTATHTRIRLGTRFIVVRFFSRSRERRVRYLSSVSIDK